MGSIALALVRPQCPPPPYKHLGPALSQSNIGQPHLEAFSVSVHLCFGTKPKWDLLLTFLIKAMPQLSLPSSSGKTIFRRRSSSISSVKASTGNSVGDVNPPLESPASQAVDGESPARPTTSSSKQIESLVASDNPSTAQHIDVSSTNVEPCAVLEPLAVPLADSLKSQNDIINSAIVNSASISPSADSDIASSSASSPLSLSPQVSPKLLPTSSTPPSELLREYPPPVSRVSHVCRLCPIIDMISQSRQRSCTLQKF